LAADRVVHEEITKVAGSFDRTLRAAKLLKNKGIRVILDTVLVKKNQHQIKKLKNLSQKLAIPHCFLPLDYPEEGRGSISKGVFFRRYKVNKPRHFYWRLTNV
jgi:MoaA/NifB/PqqE/SkfB family radical SAM enzyme